MRKKVYNTKILSLFKQIIFLINLQRKEYKIMNMKKILAISLGVSTILMGCSTTEKTMQPVVDEIKSTTESTSTIESSDIKSTADDNEGANILEGVEIPYVPDLD